MRKPREYAFVFTFIVVQSKANHNTTQSPILLYSKLILYFKLSRCSSSYFLQPTVASKTLAERAAWDFMKSAPHFTLTTLCPSVILGPAPQPLSSLKSLNQSSKVIWGLVDAPAVPPTFAPVGHSPNLIPRSAQIPD